MTCVTVFIEQGPLRTMPVLGTCRLSMHNPKNRKKYNAKFVVVEDAYTPLIGSRASQHMNLVTVQKENIQLLTAETSLDLTVKQVTEAVLRRF